MNTPSIRVLVVDDYEPWHDFISKTLRKAPDVQIIGDVSDGLQAVQQAQQLQPDLIMLDIGLPTLNGIEAARRIREVSPASKILFLSENSSPEIWEAALDTGASGYVVKSSASSDLLPAVTAVLQGKSFVSSSLTAHDPNAPKSHHRTSVAHCHEVAFYRDDASIVDGYARFIQFSLKNGDSVIVVVTGAHHASLLSRLEANGMNVPAASEQGRYIALDASDVLARLTVDDMPDPVLCTKVIGDLITEAAKGIKGEHGRVVVCGEIAPTLLSKGSAEGAIMLERLWDKITRGYGVRTLCGYLTSAFPNWQNNPVFERICAEHSAVHGLGY